MSGEGGSAAERAELLRRAAARQELARRRRAHPLSTALLWDRELPRSSQRRALAALAEPGCLFGMILGGNRTGKSEVAAMWAVAAAAGSGAWWVREWLTANGLPLSLVPAQPGRVWVASPTFASAAEQIRPKIRRWCPADTSFSGWDNKNGQAEAKLPGGGIIVSKAYRQYDQDAQTWEGTAIQGLVLDEQPSSYACLSAGISRCTDFEGKVLLALTPLRGKRDWLYQKLYRSPPAWVRIHHLRGRDNPHVPQERRALAVAAAPAWERASREDGEFGEPEGAIYPLDTDLHLVEPFEIPPEWKRYLGIDWGSRAPHAVWVAESPSSDLYAYREHAPRRTSKEPGIPDSQFISELKQLEEAAGEKRCRRWYRVADSESPGAIEEAARQGLWLTPASKPKGSVVDGITLLQALLATVDPLTQAALVPRLRFFRGCVPVLWEEMTGMSWKPNDGAELGDDPMVADGADHGPDGLRYAMMYRRTLGGR